MYKTTILLALLSALDSSSLAQTTSTEIPAHSGGPGSGDASRACQQPAGDFNITAYQLYPEKADFDADRCCVYMSVLYNASVAVYDVRQKRVARVISVPKITGDPVFHASGLLYDRAHARLLIMLNAGSAFNTKGKDISGANNIVSYDLETNQIRFNLDLSQHAQPGLRGFQDIEHDNDGNLFVVGSYGGSLLRVSADGKDVSEWWASSQPAPVNSLTGVAKYDLSTTLLITDQVDSQLYRFYTDKKNKRDKVPLSGATGLGNSVDGIYLPPRYNGNVLLVSDNDDGTVVLRTRNRWATAEWLGTIPNQFLDSKPFPGSAVASVQIVDRIYVVTEWFADNGGTQPGNRTQFPMIDITHQIDQLMSDASFGSTASKTTTSVPVTGASARMAASLSILGAAAGLAAGLGWMWH